MQKRKVENTQRLQSINSDFNRKFHSELCVKSFFLRKSANLYTRKERGVVNPAT